MIVGPPVPGEPRSTCRGRPFTETVVVRPLFTPLGRGIPTSRSRRPGVVFGLGVTSVVVLKTLQSPISRGGCPKELDTLKWEGRVLLILEGFNDTSRPLESVS